jgi:hypothetical protein
MCGKSAGVANGTLVGGRIVQDIRRPRLSLHSDLHIRARRSFVEYCREISTDAHSDQVVIPFGKAFDRQKISFNSNVHVWEEASAGPMI